MTVNDAGDEGLLRGDLCYLARSLTHDGLIPEKIFAARRGIRSCTPPLELLVPPRQFLIERLQRAVPLEEG
jgi:hypothetical protein